MMIGVEIVKNKHTKEYGIEEREEILNKCFNNGLLLLPAGISSIRVIPPLTMKMENIEKGLEIFENAVKEVSKIR